MFQPLNNLSIVNCNTLVLRYFYLWINLHDRPFVAKLSVWPIFHKMTGYITGYMPEMEKACRKYQNGQFEGPVKRDWDFMMVWFFTKIWRFVWKKLLESKVLLSSNIFHTNLLNFFENSNSRINFKYSLIPGASNLATLLFLICSFYTIPFLAIWKLQSII